MGYEGAFAAVVGLVALLYSLGVMHVVNEGFIGIYYRGGALASTWTEPGLHFMIPALTRMHEVQVTLQTDKVERIPCGTSSGVVVHFDRIEVVNRLRHELAFETIKNYTVDYDKTWIFNKIHHEINQFCSGHSLQEVLIDKFAELDESLKDALERGCKEWAPGIEIISVRVTKPNVPQEIRLSYEKREIEKTKLLVVREEQRVAEKIAETEKLVMRVRAETAQKRSEVQIRKELMVQELNKQLTTIDNEIQLAREHAASEAAAYAALKRIEINEQKLFSENLLYQQLRQLASVPKTFYGTDLAEYFAQVPYLLNLTAGR